MPRNTGSQIIKSTALNAIRKIYCPLYNFPYDKWSDSGSFSEQRERRVQSIIEKMEKDLLKLKKKNKMKKSMDKKVLEELFNLYSDAFRTITQSNASLGDARELCYSKGIFRGLCFAAVQFGGDFYRSPMAAELLPYLKYPSHMPEYIAMPLANACTVEELLSALNARIDVLIDLRNKAK